MDNNQLSFEANNLDTSEASRSPWSAKSAVAEARGCLYILIKLCDTFCEAPPVPNAPESSPTRSLSTQNAANFLRSTATPLTKAAIRISASSATLETLSSIGVPLYCICTVRLWVGSRWRPQASGP